MPRFYSVNFYQTRPKIRLFLPKKIKKFEHWGLSPLHLLATRLNRAVIARGRSPYSSTQEPEIEKQRLAAGNLKFSRKTYNAEDLLTQDNDS